MFLYGKTPPLVKHSLPKAGREALSPSSTYLAMKRLCRGRATQARRAPGTCRWSGTHRDAALTPLCILLTPQEGERGRRKRGQQDIAFLAKQSQQTWGSPGSGGYFPTPCQGTALPWAPSPAMRGGAHAPATPNAHENTGETLGSLMGGPALATVPGTRDLRLN